MDEVPAEVVEERVPEPPKFEPFIVQWIGADHGALPFKTLAQAEKEAADCRSDGFPARILRVQPPTQAKKQRVEIDWGKVKGEILIVPEVGMVAKWPEIIAAIERHARIVDEEVQP